MELVCQSWQQFQSGGHQLCKNRWLHGSLYLFPFSHNSNWTYLLLQDQRSHLVVSPGLFCKFQPPSPKWNQQLKMVPYVKCGPTWSQIATYISRCWALLRSPNRSSPETLITVACLLLQNVHTIKLDCLSKVRKKECRRKKEKQSISGRSDGTSSGIRSTAYTSSTADTEYPTIQRYLE